MNKDQQDELKFLIEQQKWCKEQDVILEKIEAKLLDMKDIAQYALSHDLNSEEIERLNNQLRLLKREVELLEQKLQTVVH